MNFNNYTFFLFDFDGLLVNTEHLHFKAYQHMCGNRGYSLDWDMPTYASYALFSATAVKEAIYAKFPKLNEEAPTWDILYKEKKNIYLSLLESESLSLMPGVEAFLREYAHIKSCVVTNSPSDQVKWIKRKLPALEAIPHWITREDYKEPKPHPDGYLTALSRFCTKEDRVLGFEDSPRGLKSLLGANVEGILVSSFFNHHQLLEIKEDIKKPFTHHSSFSEI